MNTTSDTSTPLRATGPKRLRRSTQGSVAGVAKGLATYLGVETKWVRIAFLVSLLFGGGGFFFYLAAWLAIPDENDPRTDAFVLTQNVTRLIAAGVFAVFAFGAISGTATLSAGLLIPAALVGGGIYLLMQSDDSSSRIGGQYPKAETSVGAAGAVPPPPAAPAEAPSAPLDTTPAPTPEPAAEEDADGAADDDRDPLLIEAEKLMTGEFHTDPAEVYRYDPPHWAAARSEADVAVVVGRRKPRITLPVLGMATLVSALLLVTDRNPGFVAYAGIFLGFSVAGFVGSLLFRRPAWLLLPVALVSLFLTFGAATGWRLDGGFGEREFMIDMLEGEVNSYELGAGRLALDLDRLTLEENRAIEAYLVFGQIDLDLPDDVRVELVMVDDAMLEFENGDDDWRSAGDRILINADAPEEPVLEIRAELDGLGVVTIDRLPAEITELE